MSLLDLSERPRLGRVGVVGILKPTYPRSEGIIKGLGRLGYVVLHYPLPRQATTWRRLITLLRYVPQLRQVDWWFVPHSNQLIAPFIWLLATLLGKTVLIDYMIGLTDVYEDRGYPNSLKRLLAIVIDRFNIARMDSLTDTTRHRRVFARLLGAFPSRMRVLPIGAREGVAALPLPPDSPVCVVQWVGTYIPFQGVEVILHAAACLRDREDIHFELIGDGQSWAAAHTFAKRLNLPNVRLVRGAFRFDALESMVAKSSILLGVFGDAPKTRYVVPNKVLDALTWGRPLITAEAEVLYETLRQGEGFITVPPGDPDALASAILRLAEQPELRTALREQGRRYILQHLAGDAQLARLKAIIEDVL